MFSEEKIKQVFYAINENGLDAFDDESLAKLLSMLTPVEFDEFEKRSYKELDGYEGSKRIMNIKPLVNLLVNKDLYKIRTSEIYPLYIESLERNEYRQFFKSLKVEELASLKKYVSYTARSNDSVNLSGSKKIINMITKEIKAKESEKKPSFGDTVAA